MPRFAGQQVLLLAAALLHKLAPAAAQLSCLTRLTHIHYESVAAIDMVILAIASSQPRCACCLTYTYILLTLLVQAWWRHNPGSEGTNRLEPLESVLFQNSAFLVVDQIERQK